VTARTRATTKPTQPATPPDPIAPPLEERDQEEHDHQPPTVTPLSFFDPYQEATKRW
jgi:hypothetical protein